MNEQMANNRDQQVASTEILDSGPTIYSVPHAAPKHILVQGPGGDVTMMLPLHSSQQMFVVTDESAVQSTASGVTLQNTIGLEQMNVNETGGLVVSPGEPKQAIKKRTRPRTPRSNAAKGKGSQFDTGVDALKNALSNDRYIGILKDAVNSSSSEKEAYLISIAVVTPDIMKDVTLSKLFQIQHEFKENCGALLMEEGGSYVVMGPWQCVQKGSDVLKEIVTSHDHESNEETLHVEHNDEAQLVDTGGDTQFTLDSRPVNTGGETEILDSQTAEADIAETRQRSGACDVEPPESEKATEEPMCEEEEDTQASPPMLLEDLQCSTCEKVFICSLGLERHLARHPDGGKQERCKVCRKRFHNFTEIIAHSKAVHPEVWKGRRRKPDRVVQSKQEQYELPEEACVCDRCEAQCNSRLTMAKHVSEEHRQPIHCPYCKEDDICVLNDFASVVEHIQTNHFNKKGRFVRGWRRVRRGVEVQSRERVQREIKCTLCGVKLPAKDMARHVLCAHDGTERQREQRGDEQRGEDNTKRHADGDGATEEPPQRQTAKKGQAVNDGGGTLSAVADDTETTRCESAGTTNKVLVTARTPRALLTAREQTIKSLIKVRYGNDRETPAEKVNAEEKYGISTDFQCVHTCGVCGVQTTKWGLRRHVQRYHQKKTLSCLHCSEKFALKSDLDTHVRRHYDKDGNYRELRKRGGLQILPKEIPIYECKVCHREFKRRAVARKHVEIHLDDNNELRYSGGQLPLKRSAAARLEQPAESVDEARFECDKCARKFYRMKDMNLHRKTCNISRLKENTDDELYKCDYCRMVNSSRSALADHIKTQHREKNQTCDVCGASFVHLFKLKEHLAERHGGMEVCKLCGKEFRKGRYLAAHMKRHLGKKGHVCKICNKAFYDRYRLKIHMKIHAPDRESAEKCHICGKTGVTPGFLRQHLAIHSGTLPYACALCEKAFPLPSALARHMVAHSDARPYTCPEPTCSRAFKYRNKLHYHMTVHTGVSSHRCPDCGKAFTESHSLGKHIAVCKKSPSKSAVTVATVTERSSEEWTDEAATSIGEDGTLGPGGVKEVYMCSVCSKLFHEWAAVEAHMQQHHAVQEPRGAEVFMGAGGDLVLSSGGVPGPAADTPGGVSVGDVLGDGVPLPGRTITMSNADIHMANISDVATE